MPIKYLNSNEECLRVRSEGRDHLDGPVSTPLSVAAHIPFLASGKRKRNPTSVDLKFAERGRRERRVKRETSDSGIAFRNFFDDQLQSI